MVVERRLTSVCTRQFFATSSHNGDENELRRRRSPQTRDISGKWQLSAHSINGLLARTGLRSGNWPSRDTRGRFPCRLPCLPTALAPPVPAKRHGDGAVFSLPPQSRPDSHRTQRGPARAVKKEISMAGGAIRELNAGRYLEGLPFW
jgi:hypothetical protein